MRARREGGKSIREKDSKKSGSINAQRKAVASPVKLAILHCHFCYQ